MQNQTLTFRAQKKDISLILLQRVVHSDPKPE